jgi:putative ATP-dependent endonuclease of the OLD family
VLRLIVTYDEDDNLAPLSEMILDLDEDCFTVTIEAALEVAKPEHFLVEYEAASRRELFVEDKYLRTHFSRHFKLAYYAVASVGEPPARRALMRSAVRGVLSVRLINAQVRLDDSGTDRTRSLSKSFEAFYHANSVDEDRNQNVESIDAALAVASKRVDENSAVLFEPIFQDLRAFGVQSIAPVQQPRIVTQIDSGAVLRGSTRVEYPSEIGDTSLPEGHNGLGYSKLIFTILQIVGFYEAYRRSVPRPALQLLFVEEPEAHLHPQMQEAFISNIRAFLDGKDGWNVQVLITTHSSHIVAKSGFECVRYFDRADSGVRIRDLLNFQTSVESQADGVETLRFLRQYMELRRCDMFFADKIILIEGTVERLLLPKMITRCAPSLQHKYISIVEVGGAYALKFKDLLAFLGVRTLVITDLDSGEAAGRYYIPRSWNRLS